MPTAVRIRTNFTQMFSFVIIVILLQLTASKVSLYIVLDNDPDHTAVLIININQLNIKLAEKLQHRLSNTLPV